MSSNVFVNEIDDYVRDIDLVTAWEQDMARGISLVKKISFEKALEFVKGVTGKGGKFEIKDPRMKYVGRDQNGDRELRMTTFLGYLNTVVQNKLIISPSLAVYMNKEQKESISAIYISGNVKKRSKSKKEMFAAKEAGDKPLAEFKNLEQNNAKIKNNALSGAHCTKSTILFIDTIHSTLTSTCRSASGYGNSNNEKITCGNRHYWSPDIVKSNILNIINTADLDLFQQCIDKYNLYIPTPEDVMDVITYSTRNYWRDKRVEDIRVLVNSLEPIHRVAFVYTSDLYHVKKYNDSLMRRWLGGLAKRVTGPIENPKAELEGLTEEAEALVSMICGKFMDGNGLGKFDILPDDVQQMLGATAKNVREVMTEFELLTRAVLVSECMPPTLAHLPHILRRGAVASDTDSTIFTVQDWLAWYSGSISNDEETIAVGHSIAFLASSTITHILAKMSANMGVAKKQLHQYAMKSEYWFPVFALTSRAKTYFALRAAQEGIVFKKEDIELEIKGAVLKGSNSPKYVIDDATALITELLHTVNDDKQIEITSVFKRIADLERELISKIKAGSPEFFKKLEIKEESSYKNGPLRSNYFHYLLWDNVFAPKYGSIQEPPYASLRIALNTDSKSAFNEWLDRIEDVEFKDRLVKFLAESGKGVIKTILIPKPYADSHGFPEEIIQAMDIRRMIATIMEPHYVICESLGFQSIEDNKLRLISDEY